jgi:hypothetical protein
VKSTTTNPADWHVQQHPAYAGAGAAGFNGQPLDRTGFIYARLLTFLSWRASDSFMSKRRNSQLVLGFGDRVAAHSILDVERLANGEGPITLRTRASIGVLPDLNEALIPEAFSKIVKEQYEKAANAAFHDDAESVIDRCREAAAAALNAERSLTIEQGESSQAKDLSDSATYFGSAKFGVHGGRLILSNAARIIARLHARTKSSERLNKGSLGASEGGGECALARFSTSMLQDESLVAALAKANATYLPILEAAAWRGLFLPQPL